MRSLKQSLVWLRREPIDPTLERTSHPIAIGLEFQEAVLKKLDLISLIMTFRQHSFEFGYLLLGMS